MFHCVNSQHDQSSFNRYIISLHVSVTVSSTSFFYMIFCHGFNKQCILKHLTLYWWIFLHVFTTCTRYRPDALGIPLRSLPQMVLGIKVGRTKIKKKINIKVFLCGSCCMQCSNPDSLVESLLQPYLKPITIRIPAAKGRPDLVS